MGKYKEKTFKQNTRLFKDRLQKIMFDENIPSETRKKLPYVLNALELLSEYPKGADAEAMEAIDARISSLLDKMNADIAELSLSKISGGAKNSAMLTQHADMLLQATVAFRQYGTKRLSDDDLKDQDSLAEITADIADSNAQLGALDTRMDELVQKAAKCEGPSAVAEKNRYKSEWNSLKVKRGTLERSIGMLNARKTALDSAVSVAGLAITAEKVRGYELDVQKLAKKAAETEKAADRLQAENEAVNALAAELNDALGVPSADDGVFEALVDERKAQNFKASVEDAGDDDDEFDKLVRNNADI